MPLHVVAVIEEGVAKGEGTVDALFLQVRLKDVYLKGGGGGEHLD